MTLGVQYGLKAPFKLYREIHGQMAQLVARIPCKDEVIGSTPVLSRFNHLFFFRFVFQFFVPFLCTNFRFFAISSARGRERSRTSISGGFQSHFFFFLDFIFLDSSWIPGFALNSGIFYPQVSF